MTNDDANAVALALIRVTFTDDRRGAELLMDGVSPWQILGAMTGIARILGILAAGDEDRFVAMLTAWQPGQKLGEGFGVPGE
jgi:hypothetical protein